MTCAARTAARPVGPRPRRLFAVLAAAVLMAGLAGCSGGGSGNGSNANFVSGDGTYTIVPVKDRRDPVLLTGTTLDGSTIDLASLRGKPVVLNVWGSWCAPCRKEAPDLEAASVELKKQDIPLIGINTRDDGTAPAKAFEREFKITYPSLVDDGTTLLALKGAVSAKAIPTTLVLDSQGRIAARSMAAITTTTLLGLVQDATKA